MSEKIGKAIVVVFAIGLPVTLLVALIWSVAEGDREYMRRAPIQMPSRYREPSHIIGFDPYTIDALAEAIVSKQESAMRRILKEFDRMKPDEDKQTYVVHMRTTAEWDAHVQADSEEEARRIAEKYWWNMRDEECSSESLTILSAKPYIWEEDDEAWAFSADDGDYIDLSWPYSDNEHE